METSDKEGCNNGDGKNKNNSVKESSANESYEEEIDIEGSTKEDENERHAVPIIVVEELQKEKGIDRE